MEARYKISSPTSQKPFIGPIRRQFNPVDIFVFFILIEDTPIFLRKYVKTSNGPLPSCLIGS
jgi:hypothetical protein